MNNIALVTDLKVASSPQAGLGVARCLKDAGFDIIGVDETSLVTTNRNLFKRVFCWEEVRTLNLESLLKKIADLKKLYNLKYIFPCYDETVILFSLLKEKLDSLNIALIAPHLSAIKAIQKVNLPNLVKNLDNYMTPKTKLIKSVNEAVNFAETISYPVICKGLIKGAYICGDEDDLKQNIKKIANIWNQGKVNCLVQKYIKGEYKNCAMAIKRNKITGYVEITKIGLDENGATWFGNIDTSKKLLGLARHIVKSLPFNSSIIELETICNNEGCFLYEINPRSPAWIHAPSQLGLNLPELTIKPLDGQIKFIKKRGYFGRETQHFIRKDIGNLKGTLDLLSKATSYNKSKNLKFPSDFLQNIIL